MNFILCDGASLYVSESNAPGWTVGLYYLMMGPGNRPQEISFDAAWTSRSGAYFFLPSNQPITDPAAFVGALKQLLQNPAPESQWLAWVPSAAPADVTAPVARVPPSLDRACPGAPSRAI